jgi:hypothetical protein
MIKNSKLNNLKKINNRHGHFNKNYINCSINNLCIKFEKNIIDSGKKKSTVNRNIKRSILDIQNLLDNSRDKLSEFSEFAQLLTQYDKNETISKDPNKGLDKEIKINGIDECIQYNKLQKKEEGEIGFITDEDWEEL